MIRLLVPSTPLPFHGTNVLLDLRQITQVRRHGLLRQPRLELRLVAVGASQKHVAVRPDRLRLEIDPPLRPPLSTWNRPPRLSPRLLLEGGAEVPMSWSPRRSNVCTWRARS